MYNNVFSVTGSLFVIKFRQLVLALRCLKVYGIYSAHSLLFSVVPRESVTAQLFHFTLTLKDISR
jgi:hypothetical protein